MYIHGETPLMFGQLCFIKLPLNKSIYTSHKAGLSYQKENGDKITQLMSLSTWYLMIEHGYQNKFPSFPN